eukprot:TRINITY_DN8812_c0_g1_i2.p1 TRINITY_DN8812_c0_g1~~TRINITY_DN8812_c0_g1_i2.p1  ORF type:complete len:159 (-),score=49.14 TRINITY_DN8812_c0_g1_i2:518-994(-)
MRFKARIAVVSALERLLQVADKINNANGSESTVLVMSASGWSFRIRPGSGVTAGVMAFVEIPHATVFDKYRISSSNADDAICVLLDLSNLVRALKSAVASVSSKIMVSLVKKQDNLIYLEFTVCGDSMILEQLVPVQMSNAQKIQDSSEPDVPEPIVG